MGEDRVVDLTPELAFESLHRFGKGVGLGAADNEDVNVAGGAQLIVRERAVEVSLLYPFDLR